MGSIDCVDFVLLLYVFMLIVVLLFGGIFSVRLASPWNEEVEEEEEEN